MLFPLRSLSAFFLTIGVLVTSGSPSSSQTGAGAKSIVEAGRSEKLVLPKPYATPSARNRAKVIGWPEGGPLRRYPAFK